MSAFVVNEEHIRYLVNAGMSRSITKGYGLSWDYDEMEEGFGPDADEHLNRIGAMLWQENYASVNHRYGESHDGWRLYSHKREPSRHFDPVQVLKAIACYEYQSCEHEGWKVSQARSFCEALRHAAISALPGYDAASWAVTS